MPYKNLSKRREFAEKYYSSPEQKAKKKEYDKRRYLDTKDKYKESRSEHTYPHRYRYNGEWVCTECGSNQDLVIHHIDHNHNHNNNNPKNLQCLCVSCHSKHHIQTRARNAHGQVINN